MDGENLSVNLSTEIIGVTMTVVDRVLYSHTTFLNQDVKLKTTLSDEDFEAFTESNNTDMPVTSENFETLTMETRDNKQIVTCTGITSEGLTAMNDLLADSLTSMGAEAAVGDLKLVAAISDGLFESMALTATYSVTVKGETHTRSLTMNAKYSYDNVLPVTAPADADSYKDVSFDDIMGQ